MARRTLIAALTAAFVSSSAAVAQEPTASGGPTGSAGVADSGVGLGDEAEAWIGQTVVGADGQEIGTLRSIAQTGGASSEAALLVVEDATGGQVEIPLEGATSDGGTVRVTTPAQTAD